MTELRGGTHPDPARPGRIRRLAVAVAPAVLALAVSAAVVAVHLANPTDFEGWSSGRFLTPAALVAATALVLSLYYWRWPQLQRWTAVASCAVSGAFIVIPILELAGRLSSADAAAGANWPLLAGWLAAPLGGLLGWLLAGRLPSPPAATAAPHPSAPTLPLASGQKALFTTARWSAANLAGGAVLLAVCIVLIVQDPTSAGVPFLLLALVMLGQAHARLHVDGGGIVLVVAGFLRLPLPYQHVRQAYVLAASPSPMRFAPVGSAHGWGFATGRGPALALDLTDGRRFVYSTRQAESAAELVNGFLTRERANADHD